MCLQLTRYNIQIKHINGKNMFIADMLSCLIPKESVSKYKVKTKDIHNINKIY